MAEQSPRRAPVRESIARLEPYNPVESPESLARRLGMSIDQIVKLDSNENPYGCSYKVQEALATFDRFHHYPDANATHARERIATYAGANVERLLLGNGADELIDLLLLTTVDPGDEVLLPTPTFGVYRARTALFGGVPVEIPRLPDFELDIDAMVNAVTDRTKVIFVTSPNNPTGNQATTQQIVQLLHTGALVVVDEAYYEMSGKTVMPLVGEFDNLCVLRTFSKWAGLAGLRIGYGVFPGDIAANLWKVKPPFNVSQSALAAVEASLDDVEYLMGTVSRIKAERNRLFRRLQRVEYLEPYPSVGNFILCRVTSGDAHDVHLRLSDRGIMVRRYGEPALRDCLRISVGRPEDTTRLMNALQAIAAYV